MTGEKESRAVEAGRDSARQAILTEIAERRWTVGDLAGRAEVDPGTVGDFLNGRRWPQRTSQARIETALDWRPGTIGRIAQGAQTDHGAQLGNSSVKDEFDVRVAAEAVASLSEIRASFTGADSAQIGHTIRLIAERLRGRQGSRGDGERRAIPAPTMTEGRAIADLILGLQQQVDQHAADGNADGVHRAQAVIADLTEQLARATQALTPSRAAAGPQSR